MSQKNIFSVSHKPSDSPIWSDMLKVKDLYLQGRSVEIQNGGRTRFWDDIWLYKKPICEVEPMLYNLCNHKDVMVDDVRKGKVQLSFRREMTNALTTSWSKIMNDMTNFHFSNLDDKIIWGLGKNKVFSVKALYNALTKTNEGSDFKNIWKGKVPQKIKIFHVVGGQ